MLPSIVSVILTILLGISVYFNVKFGIIILRMQDTIEDCLDALDERFQVFSKILEKPVFFDSPEIRQVIQEIRKSQEILLKIANSIANPGETDSNETEK
jgi:hypothetical protein